MTENIQNQTSEAGQCPSYLPTKFWDEKKGQPRMEAMAQSYRDMERKVGAGMHKTCA